MESLSQALYFLFMWVVMTVIVFLFVGVIFGTPLLNKYENDDKKKNKCMICLFATSAFIALVGMFYYKIM